jgi:hypothetical protein
MLVPAFAFAWWLVSMPAVPPHAIVSRSLSRSTVRRAEPSVETQSHGDAPDDESTPADESAVEEGDGDERGGERVAVKVVTTAIMHTAQSFLDLPMGAERFVTIDGRRYVFVLERHYHPPGFVGAPTGWHKGVTAYELR